MHADRTLGAPVPNQAPRVGVLVPVKSFALAKQRLTDHLDGERRNLLARWCAQRVIKAGHPFEVFVVCDSDDVEHWAAELGVATIRSNNHGLNPSIEYATQVLATRGFDLALVVHGDLPLASSFGHLVADGWLTIVPDVRYDGTNAMVIPTALTGRFAFQYGRGSFRRHVVEAVSHWPSVRVVRDELLARDLDTPDDLLDERMEEVRQWLQTNPANRP